MEFIEVDAAGRQVAKAQGGCRPAVWNRIRCAFDEAGLSLGAGSQVLVRLKADLSATFGFQVDVEDVDLTFALGDLNSRMQAIRKRLQDAGFWNANRSLPRPDDFLRVAVIAPSGAAGLGDFRSTADRLEEAGLAEFSYHEVPFQTRDAPRRIVDALRTIYRSFAGGSGRECAVAIIRGGGASADLAWLVDDKLTEAVCRMNVPVMTGIGHVRDRSLLDEVACMTFDTPSKLVEHIWSVIVQSALGGRQALEAIRSGSLLTVDRCDAELAATTQRLHLEAIEGVRDGELLVWRTAGEIEPRSLIALDGSISMVAAALHSVETDARELLRIAEGKVLNTALSLEPGARLLLDDVEGAVSIASSRVRTGPRRTMEEAVEGVAGVRRSLSVAADDSVRPLELGIERALSGIRIRLEAVPQVVSVELEGLRRRISDDVAEAVHGLAADVAASHRLVVNEAVRTLDGCGSLVAMVQERADALHPRNVLAAGYAILRDVDGRPLNGIKAVEGLRMVTADMRDGRIRFRHES